MKNLIYAARPLALDLISTLVFVAIGALTHNPMIATVVALGAGLGRVAWLRAKGQHINAMQWLSLGLVVVAGAATLITHNPRFMMAKATVVYVLVGAAMLERGWVLPYMAPRGRELLDPSVMIRWGYVWAGMMFATAALNAGFALFASFAVWSAFITTVPLASKLALFAVQFVSLRTLAVRRHRANQAQAATAACPA